MARRSKSTQVTRKVVGYVRVSTAKQADGGHSIEAQRARLATYCELYGLELVEVFADEGASASKMEGRPGLADAFDAVRKGRADGLLVCALDRLTRSVRDLAAILDDCTASGWALLSVSEQLDTASAAGRLIVGILGVVGQWQRESTNEKTSETMRNMREAGIYTGGKVRYGFRLAADGASLVEDEAEQLVIEAVRELRASGLSLRKVAAILEGRGMMARGGKRWAAQTIAQIEAA